MSKKKAGSKKEKRQADVQEKKARKRGNLFAFLLAGVVVAGGVWYGMGLWSPTPRIAEAAPEALAQGATLYTLNCASCHGPKAVGQDPLQPRGGMTPTGGYLAPALNGSAHAWHHPPDVLFSIIKDGSPAKESPMRGWKERLSDEEIGAVMGYMFSLWPEPIKVKYRRNFPGA